VTAALVIGRLTAPMHSFLIAGLAVVILARARLRAAAAFLALSASAGVALTEVLKVSIGRSRPPGAEQYETDLAKSYPSGHSSAGIYLYLAAGTVLVQLGRATGAAWMSRMGWALIAFGPAIGVTRLVLGVHWPTDVVAGWALGSTAALTAALLLWTAISRGWPMVGAAPRAALGAGPGTAAESAPGTAAAGASSEPGHSGASSEPGHSGASSEPGHSGAGGEPGSEPGRGGGAGMGGPGTG
jgi:membrane-associated phospholipid phosphatase